MRRDGRSARSVSAVIAVLLSGGQIACHHRPPVETLIVFDGQAHTIATTKVLCTNQPDGSLVILVADTPTRTVRVHLTLYGRLVVEKAGLRYDDMSGFVANPQEVSATKVDDTFTFSGRMPPNPGESQWHTFKVQTTCPGYQDALPSMPQPANGAP
jgi:Mycobacterium 19 kDa lipoprotein antigen